VEEDLNVQNDALHTKGFIANILVLNNTYLVFAIRSRKLLNLYDIFANILAINDSYPLVSTTNYAGFGCPHTSHY